MRYHKINTKKKQVGKKKATYKTQQNKEKPNFKLFVILNSPEVKDQFLTALGYTDR